MISIDQTVVAVALEPMARSLGLTTFVTHGVVLVYILALAAFVPVGGMLVRRFGLLTAFRSGITVFALASGVCALAPHGDSAEPFLLTARAVQGIGAALLMPVGTALITEVYEERRRGKALSVYAGLAQVFLVVGPIVGAFLTQLLGWRSVFLINVPVGAVSLWLMTRARLTNEPQGGPLSIMQPLLMVSSMVLLVLGLYQCGNWGVADPRTLAALAAGAVTVAVGVRLLLRSPRPLVDLRLLRIRPYAVGVALTFLVQGPQLVVLVHGTLFLRQSMHLSLLATGIALLPLVVASATGTFLSGFLRDRTGSARVPVLAGLTAATIGAAAWTVALPSQVYVWQVPGMILTGLGTGLPVPALSAELMRVVPADKRADASVLRSTLRQLGGAIGLAVAGAVVLAVNNDLSDAVGIITPTATRAAFAVASAALALALSLAAFLLPREGRTR
ncbi:MFS transporter [Streptomyces sp. NPDC002138]|uniref:MFS transporter n=1 Tax=Streptomyces sp. NPDC002138 TaxID=3154410 RepID=UPI00331D85FD